MSGRPSRYVDRDIWDDAWEVKYSLHTDHGFPILMGIPAVRERRRGSAGRPQAIMTRPLADFLEAHRSFDDDTKWKLPVGPKVVKRLRAALGHHKVQDSQAWWLDRIADLRELEYGEFAKKHGCGFAAAAAAHKRLIGKRNLDIGWYRLEPYRSQILADKPLAMIADEMELPVGYINNLRMALRKLDS